MSARSFSGYAALFAASLLRAQEVPPPAANDLFDGRALKGHSRNGDPKPLQSLIGSDLDLIYKSIHPERSLILFDCTKGSCWCSQPDFTFRSILSKAASALSVNKQALAKAWYQTAVKDSKCQVTHFDTDMGGWTGDLTSPDPFQPLAIVNRMDLAERNPKTERWKNAEVRFVFGRLPDGGKLKKFTLIFEFRLAERSEPEFIELAKKWQALSAVTGDDYLSQLKAALKESRFESSDYIRIRTNRALEDELWRVTEWDLEPRRLPKSVSALFEQINPKYSEAPYDPRDVKNKGPAAVYRSIWNASTAPGGVSMKLPRGMPNDIFPLSLNYDFRDLTLMGTPQGLCGASPKVRNVLALQQCSWCHSSETGTRQFVHIANRQPRTSSALSTFLTGTKLAPGATSIPLPSMEDLYYADKADTAAVPGSYCTYVSDSIISDPRGQCLKVTTPPAPNRRFNDLARRALFLAEVLLIDKDVPTAGPLLIQEFRTQMTH